MKNINNTIFLKVCKMFNLVGDEYEYYNSGKCSDLYLNKKTNVLLKINLWHIKTDTKNKVLKKLQSKLDFINYLEENNYPIVGIKKYNNHFLYRVIEYQKKIYVVYFMDYKPHNNELVDVNSVIPLIKKFHELSRKYKIKDNLINSWGEDFGSVLSACSDNELRKKMYEFKSMFDNMNHDNYGYLHFDINRYNYIMSNNQIYMIDFDTMVYGWYLMDVANYMFNYSVISFKENLFKSAEELNKLYNVFLDKYDENINIFDLEIFLRYRRIYLYIILKSGIDAYNVEISNEIKKDIMQNKPILTRLD